MYAFRISTTLLLPGPISSLMLASGTAPLLQNSRRFEPGLVKSVAVTQS